MVWYPAEARSIHSSTPPAQYPLDPYSTNLPVSTSKNWESLGYDLAYEGPAPADHGPFPLVVFSPGWDDDAWLHIFIGTRLASHGYVVAIIEHYADCEWPWGACDDMMTSAMNRPRDVSFVITQLIAKTRTQGELLFRTIDGERIAASGHSYGGYATYTLAAGDDLVCDGLWPQVYGQDTSPYPPSTCVPTPPDRRVKVIISLDGTSQLLRFRELDRIRIPSLIMGETVENSESMGDLAHPGGGPAMRDWIARAHAAIGRPDSYRVDVNGSNHYSFTNYCDGAQVFFNLGLISADYLAEWENSWPCANTGPAAVTLPSVDARNVVTKYMIAFLNIHFGNPGRDEWLDWWILTPEYALTHTPTVQFFNFERCEAKLPDNSYFTYRPHQLSDECDVALKDPTGWFAPE